MKTLKIAVVLLFAAPLPALAQDAEKLPITRDVYDTWNSIRDAELSRDGRWVIYSLVPQVGNGDVVVRSTGADSTEHRVSRGFVGQPRTSTSGSTYSMPRARFTADSRFAIFTIEPDRDEVEAARHDDDLEPPQTALGIFRLEDGELQTIPRLKDFQLPDESGSFVAYQTETPEEAAADTVEAEEEERVAAEPGEEPRPAEQDSVEEEDEDEKELGNPLMIRALESGDETVIDHVAEYRMDDTGRWLAYTVSAPDDDEDGAFLRELTNGATHTLVAGVGEHKRFRFDDNGSQVAFLSFLSGGEEYDEDEVRYTLYHASLNSPGEARPVVAPEELEKGMVVSDRGRFAFTDDGSALVFGIGPEPVKAVPSDSLHDKAVFDLWHWRDPRLQPAQEQRADDDRYRSHTAVYHSNPGGFVTLGSDTLPSVTLSEDGRIGLAVTSVPYLVDRTWGGDGSDVHVIDARSGERNLVAERVQFGASLSPGGAYVLFFDDERWQAYSVASGETADLTGEVEDIRFDRETWSRPSTPAPWGVAGWTTGDASVLIYDRYDVWEVDPAGRRPARNVTEGMGRRGDLVFRHVDLTPDEDFIDPAEPLFLRAFDETTKGAGFHSVDLRGGGRPAEVTMEHARFGTPERAQDGEMYMVTRSTYTEFPDLWVGTNLDELTRVSDANPHQGEYRWGSVEMVDWRGTGGEPLQGLLYKPEDFDPRRRYPMVVYFYERHSDNLHGYVSPAGRNVVNPTVYTSLGYLVFFPDVHYIHGYPGQSALNSVVPGVNAVIDRGYVNPEAVGVAGQSWGGYQAAYMITRTNLFAAAFAGAPVANMTSAYGGIRWSTGRARAFQYEQTQSRIGGSLWEYPMRYLENSPLFHAYRIETPLLMMHNDADGAVPWEQGIEMFVAMRRLRKEVYMINYNDDGHNPQKRANQLDIDMRMQQFFAHHLRGEPAPSWMTDGIPFVDKGRDQLAEEPELIEGEGEVGEEPIEEDG